MNPQPKKIYPGAEVSILPENNIQENKILNKPFLGLFAWFGSTTRKVLVEYHNNEGILQVSFKKENGIHFIGRHTAEKWFGCTIEVSPYVGQHIVTEEKAVKPFTTCLHCKESYSFGENIHIKVTGPESKVLDNVLIFDSEIPVMCPRCDEWGKSSFRG